MKKGKIIILSAPSGSGKSTIIEEIINDPDLHLEFSISATNREPRRGEVNGVNYYFMDTESFNKAISNDELVEYEEVYPGRFYGTLKKELERIISSGNNVILDIDVKGALNVKKIYGDTALSIFIMPPSIEILKHRLLSRGTESVEAINQRLSKAEYEISFANQFNKKIVNDVLLTAINEVRECIRQFINN
ncbi:MAG: guanylate kinase [Muribaculaceae bacterium]|nr:guanylate kinase [Muribaculaceae bacterium]